MALLSPCVFPVGNEYNNTFTETERIDDILQELRAHNYLPKPTQTHGEYRNFARSPLHVREFYLTQHTKQHLALSQRLISQFNDIMERGLSAKSRAEQGEAQGQQELDLMVANGEIILADPMSMLFKLEEFVDISDPDIDLGNAYHGFQTAEDMRIEMEKDPSISKELLSQVCHFKVTQCII